MIRLIKGTYPKIKKAVNKTFGGEYFEFAFLYASEQEVFREINRFNDESRRLVRFKNRYTGPAAVDITSWCDKEANTYFEAFLYFILDRIEELGERSVLFFTEKECSGEILGKLNEIFDKVEIRDLGIPEKRTSNPIGFAVSEKEENLCTNSNTRNM